MDTTTDLEIIRKSPRRFTWGKIDKIHDIGPYTIVEYTDKSTKCPTFHVYVDGKCTGTSTTTFDGALLIAIGRKNLEANEARWMSIAAGKLLGVKES